MAQFIAIGTRNYERFSEADFTPLLDAEAERVRELHMAQIFRTVWGRADGKGAVILIEAESLEAARAATDALPLVQAGMLEVTLHALVSYRGFAPRPQKT
jgi:uncharacterized protein YciI